MEFTVQQKEIARQLLEECSDDELFELFGECYEVLQAKLEKIKRKRFANYSNRSQDRVIKELIQC